MLHFTKMHGCGNDYIYFDCFEEEIQNPEALAIRLSDRHFGVGGDGIVLICPCETADARMRMFNADGSEGKMCGNAIRCVGKYLYERRGMKREVLTVATLSGIKTLHLHTDETGETVETVTVDMGQAVLNPEEIPCSIPADEEGRVIAKPVKMAGSEYRVNAVSMGNPHCVLFVHENFGDDFSLENFDIAAIGPLFENDPLFPERVNTEFALLDDGGIRMRVWERGSGETWACGTGACAVAVAAVENGFFREGEDISVRLRGGDLVINYTPERVLMTGPAAFAFDGVCEKSDT